MDNLQRLLMDGILVVCCAYAVYTSLRSKAHTYWNAEDIRNLIEIVQQEHPEYFQPEGPLPEELEVEAEEPTSEEVPA